MNILLSNTIMTLVSKIANLMIGIKIRLEESNTTMRMTNLTSIGILSASGLTFSIS